MTNEEGMEYYNETVPMSKTYVELQSQLTAAIKRIEELEANMIDAIEAPEEAANEGARILHNRKLAPIGEAK